MFTGIIRASGKLKKRVTGKNGNVEFTIKAPKLHPKLGDSIGVNGVCLTVTKKGGGEFSVDAIPETLERTSLGMLKIDAELNLEPSIKVGERLDGHLVMGHVDACVKVIGKKASQFGSELKVELPKSLSPFIAMKGSVTLNGVSLTIVAKEKSSFSVALIPFTEKHTNLGKLKSGDLINIEVDVLARYVYNNLHS